MNRAFPLGFPGPTAMYLSLYVLTLAVHVLFMNYALAGTMYVAIAAFVKRARGEAALSQRQATLNIGMTRSIVGALPFALGLAITAGVAPLLFVQVLYEKRFYTANLLLQHRWMLIVPVLIAGFYLLYLLKTNLAQKRMWLWRGAAVGAAACFLFVAWSWTENHLLSSDDHAWVATYASKRLIYSSKEIWPRLLMWVVGAFATLSVLVGWQWRTALDRGEALTGERLTRLARLGMAGVVLGGMSTLFYGTMASTHAQQVATSPIALPALLLTCLGGVLQLAAWLWIHQRKELLRGGLRLAAVGLALALVGSGAVREAVRIASVDIASLYGHHARSAQSQGLWLFLAFLVGNGAVIAFAFRIARKAALVPETAGPVDAVDAEEAAPVG